MSSLMIGRSNSFSKNDCAAFCPQIVAIISLILLASGEWQLASWRIRFHSNTYARRIILKQFGIEIALNMYANLT